MEHPEINSIHSDVKKMKKIFDNSKQVETENFRLVTTPFKLLLFMDFISGQDFIDQLTNDVLSLSFDRNDNDLYSLKQTVDLSKVEIPTISTFVSFLRNQVQPYLSYIHGIELTGKLTVASSLYEHGDYLLCHDDKLEDRCIAFVYYLTGNEGKGGGHFQMFDHNEIGQPTWVSVSIPPTKNSFVCFEVGKYTYHQVAEVLSKQFKRLSIHGWFHSEKALKIPALNFAEVMPTLQQQTILEGLVLLDEFMNLSYCTPSTLGAIREHFETESQISLPNFLNPSLYNSVAKAFKNKSIAWQLAGPANLRRYRVTEESVLKTPIETLLCFLKSSLFVSYLRNATGLSLEPYFGDTQPRTEMYFEIQKWSSGDYTMGTGAERYFDLSGLDVFLFFNSEEVLRKKKTKAGGYISYIARDEETELLTVIPHNNSLHMVYRVSDSIRFTKYINSKMRGSYYCICMTFYEPFTSTS